MTPREIVKYLDDYVIGQKDAKKVIAIALRNRWRRLNLPPEIRDEVSPKNILMIGPTGVGKTEISRRLAKLFGLPFVKVEASKYTEVGFVGRDVESMVRDLVLASYNLVREEFEKSSGADIDKWIDETIAKKLLPPLVDGASEQKLEDYQKALERMCDRVTKGEVDHLRVEVEVAPKNFDVSDSGMPMDLGKLQESFSKLFSGKNDVKKSMTVKEAKESLKSQGADKLLDTEAIKTEALKRAENGGIIFIDEIDKIAVSAKSHGRNDPSKEGVQRDLLPIVEGSNVNTKLGQIKTDNILFIAAGAFHVSKPSDLIPELQGRFPLRVELEALDEEALYAILTQTKNSLPMQYIALLSVEDVKLEFSEEALKSLAKYAKMANEATEDIGARRLHTVIEQVVEDISFLADDY
ncbi:MAG: HslU--HslV peptidase ATPase subunit, partial [Pseudomonadota bacterium]